MAEFENAWSENAAGLYYVDTQCVGCGSCAAEAPLCFELNTDENHSYVKKQPETKDEEHDCKNAMKACPVDAIGNDGEDEE